MSTSPDGCLLLSDLALALDWHARDPSLSDLVSIAGKKTRDLNEAIRILKNVTGQDGTIAWDAQRLIAKLGV